MHLRAYIKIQMKLIAIISLWRLSVEVPEDICPAHPVDNLTPEFVETSVGQIVIFDDQSMGVAAERSISWEFTIANLVVSTFWDVEVHGSISCDEVIAHTVAPGTVLGDTARAPLINFSSLQVHVIREITSNKGNACRSVSTLLVGDNFGKWDNFLVREISDIIRFSVNSLRRRSDDLRRGSERGSQMSLTFSKNCGYSLILSSLP